MPTKLSLRTYRAQREARQQRTNVQRHDPWHPEHTWSSRPSDRRGRTEWSAGNPLQADRARRASR